jgi:protein-tyrosine-phosphatase
MVTMKNILVLCTGNSCRSQIAEGYLKYLADGKATIYSAGVETHGVNPQAIAIMEEDGIDLSGHTSNNIDEYYNIDFDYIITVCDNAAHTFLLKHKNFITTSPIRQRHKELKMKLCQNSGEYEI